MFTLISAWACFIIFFFGFAKTSLVDYVSLSTFLFIRMKSETNTYWQRLDAVIRRTGLTTCRFARELGYAHPEILYRIKRGDNRISPHLAERIVSCYPEIRRCWLLCGEGPMLHEKGGAEDARPAMTFYSTSTR